MTAPLAALPLGTLVLAAIACFPPAGTLAPLRLAIMRAALLVGLIGGLATEGLSAMHRLTGPALLVVWVLAVLACAALAIRRLRGWFGGHRPLGWFGGHRPLSRLGGHRPLSRLGAAGRRRFAGYGGAELVLLGLVLMLALAELVIALVAAPNNADSQTYHLPRIEHWVQDHSVAFYPTPIHRQVGFSPGAEYLLLQLRLLAGPEEFYNLLQWAAGLGCVLVASRIAAQLGAGRRGQLLAAVVVASAPMVVLEATSTQTDLVAAFWVATGTSLALAGLRGRTRWPEVVWLGGAVGLTALTKINGLGTLAPFLVLWGVGQLLPVRRDRAAGRRLARTAAATGLILGIGVLLAGPFTMRAEREWGTLAGDPGVQIIALGRHDPAAVTINALRIGATVVTTTSAPVNRRLEHGLNDLAARLHLPAQDPDLTFTGLPFTMHDAPAPDEDYAAYPIQALAVLAGIGYALLGRRRTGAVRGYAAAAALALLVTAALVAWQPWINRLILPAFVIGAPLAGWAADDLLDRLTAAVKSRADPRVDTPVQQLASGGPDDRQVDTAVRQIAGGGPDDRQVRPGWPGRGVQQGWPAGQDRGVQQGRPAGQGRGVRLGRGAFAGLLAVLVLGVGVRAGVAVWIGQPRPLGGSLSVLTTDRERERYLRGGWRAAPYQAAARQVSASGARRVGLIQNYLSWEYPWWVELRRTGLNPTIVNLVSVLPRTPAPPITSVDAVICTLSAKECRARVPKGWRINAYFGVSVLLPAQPTAPGQPRATQAEPSDPG